MLRQAIALQNQVAVTSPEDLSNRSDVALNHYFLGDAHLNAGDAHSAMSSWWEGVRLAESMRGSATPVLSRGMLMMYRKLGELMVQRGERRAALDLGRRAVDLVDPEGSVAKRWPPRSQQALAAVGTSAMGHIYGALCRSAYRQPSDAEEARRWLEKGVQMYRAMEKQPPFTANARRELRAVESELEALNDRT
jgi:hypothetical protein